MQARIGKPAAKATTLRNAVPEESAKHKKSVLKTKNVYFPEKLVLPAISHKVLVAWASRFRKDKLTNYMGTSMAKPYLTYNAQITLKMVSTQNR